MYNLSDVIDRAPSWYKKNMKDSPEIEDKNLSEATVEELLLIADNRIRADASIHLNDKMRLSSFLSEALVCYTGTRKGE